MEVRIGAVLAGQGHNLLDPLAEAISSVPAADGVVRAGFAYATLGGVQRLLSCAGTSPNWEKVSKEMLIGVHHAITEPAALEALRVVPGAEVRVYLPGGKLKRTAFDARPLFHPKTLAVSGGGKGLRLLHAGSSNLTASAMGERPRNHELSVGVLAKSGVSLDPDGVFQKWWAALWDESRLVDRVLIRRYAKLRRDVLEKNPILLAAAEVPASIAEARYFFAEVGAGSGPPDSRHQIEFPESLVEFFGAAMRGRRDLTLRSGGVSWDKRPLSYKTTTYNVEIWRLGMPTQTAGGPPIAERAIRFERTDDSEVFEFAVVDVDDDEFRRWEGAANLDGHLGATHGQRSRKYGFYGFY
jgi:hypothetical protein